MGSSPFKAAQAMTSSIRTAQELKGGSGSEAASGCVPVSPATSVAFTGTESDTVAASKSSGGTAPAHPAVGSTSAHNVALVLSHHSDYTPLAAAIAGTLADCFDVALLTQGQPASLEHRESLVSWGSVFLVVASIDYQRDVFLMETVNYARIQQKTVVTIVGQQHYRPFGGLGAISIADGEMLDGTDWTDATRFAALSDTLKRRLLAVKYPPAAPRPSTVEDAAKSVPASGTLDSAGAAPASGIVVSYHSETEEARAVLEQEAFDAPIVAILNESSSTSSSALSDYAVLVAILSPAYERSAACREQYERARALRKPVVPLLGAAGRYSPSGWAALAIAGKLYYKFSDRASALDKGKRAYLDTVPLADFKMAVNAQLAPLPDSEARERAEIDVLTKKIADCKAKLHHWPPKVRDSGDGGHDPGVGSSCQLQLPEPPKLTMAELLEDRVAGEVFYTHYTVTRLNSVPPRPLFDSRGVPIREHLEVFISYQWDQQELVRQVYQGMHVSFNLKAWMDVYGGMLGNANEAMANGIECSDVFLCFLSAKFVASANCTLEIRYALHRKKALIFVMAEDSLELPPWISVLAKQNLTFTLRTIEDCGILDNGLPRLNRICEAIRRLCVKSVQDPLDDDITEAVRRLRTTLDDALLDLSEQENVPRWQTCTRCGRKFDENTRSGCKKHKDYYLDGGELFVSYWVCCSERSRDGPGCINADHSAEPRTFTLMPYYGTFHWVPA